MKTTVMDFTESIWNTGKFLVIGILLLALNGACELYDMENYCGGVIAFALKDGYQSKLQLNDNNRSRYCQTKFVTYYTNYSKVMFYFEDLDLDCGKGHLEFYIDDKRDSRIPGLERNICGYGKPRGVFTVDDRVFRIKYVPKRSQYISDIFSIIITTYGDGYCPSYAHKCANSRCIYKELACNGYDSCGDGSVCYHSAVGKAVIVIGSVIGLGLFISIGICCIYCTRRSGRTPGTVQSTVKSAVTYAGQNEHAYSQPIYAVNQGLPYKPSQSPHPVSSAPNIEATASGQKGYNNLMYGLDQGINYPNNLAYHPTVSQNTETNQQPTDEKLYNSPPPTYSEIFPNTEHGTN